MESTALCTRVTVVSELLPRNASASARAMLTRLVMLPAAAGAATIVMVALVLAARVPRLQVMVPAVLLHVPCELATETKAALAGRRLVSVTPVAAEGPMLV